MGRNTVKDTSKTKLPTGMMSLGNLSMNEDHEEENVNQQQNSSSLFSLIPKYFDVEKILGIGVPVRYLPHALFLTLLGVIQIGNTHYSDRIRKNQSRIKKEVEELRIDYTTLKASYMYKSKKTEVAKRVKKMKLIQGDRPPYKILIEGSGKY